MANFKLFLHLAFAALALNVVYGIVNQVPLPTIDLEEWWGPGNATSHKDKTINNFTIQFNESMITDLRSRLENHRSFVPPLEGVAFQYGFNSTTLLDWIKYLAEEYPFAEREAFLNQYPHYKTNIQGLNIHFMRIQTQNTTHTLTPLLLLHGWPGSIREFYESVPHLLSISKIHDIELDIIIPSLPGFGFSDGAVRPGLGADKMAIVMKNLMHRLGYDKFYVQCGDFGSIIAMNMATFFPTAIKGLHSNFMLIHSPEMVFQLIYGYWHQDEVTTPDLQSRLYPSWTKFFNIVAATGYLHIQATKPDTVGIGLADSPAGLMAYIMEKFATGVRKMFINYPDGGLKEILTPEQIIDNVMMYWSNNCMTTAMRLYAETFNKRYVGLRLNEIKTPVPICILQAPDDIMYLPGWLVRKKFPNLLNETLPSVGGHFYALEAPQLFAENVIDSIVAFKKWHKMNSTLYNECSSLTSN